MKLHLPIENGPVQGFNGAPQAKNVTVFPQPSRYGEHLCYTLNGDRARLMLKKTHCNIKVYTSLHHAP